MAAHVWARVVRDATWLARWLDARDPATVPHWVWAVLVVVLAAVVGRFGGRLLTALVQFALFAAALLVAWQMIQIPGPARVAAPPACVLEGTCAAGGATTPQQAPTGTATTAGTVPLAAAGGAGPAARP